MKNKKQLDTEKIDEVFQFYINKHGLKGFLEKIVLGRYYENMDYDDDQIIRKVLAEENEEKLKNMKLSKGIERYIKYVKDLIKEENNRLDKFLLEKHDKKNDYRGILVDYRADEFLNNFVIDNKYIEKQVGLKSDLKRHERAKIAYEVYKDIESLYKRYIETEVYCCFKHDKYDLKSLENLKNFYVSGGRERGLESILKSEKLLKKFLKIKKEEIYNRLYSDYELLSELPDRLLKKALEEAKKDKKIMIYLYSPEKLAKRMEKIYGKNELKEIVKEYVENKINECISEGIQYIKNAEEKIKRSEETYYRKNYIPGPFSWSAPFVDTGSWNSVSEVKMIEAAIKRGIKIDNWKEKIKKLKEPYYHVSAHPEARWMTDELNMIKESEKNIEEYLKS